MSIPVTGFVDQNGAIRKYDYASLENVPADLAKDADLDAVIAVQDTEPENDKTKLWIKETSESAVQVPTYDEFLDSIVVARGTGTNSLIEVHTTLPNIASESSSVAIGGGNQSTASGAVTIGTNNVASAQNAVAIGSKLSGADPNTASGIGSVAIGVSCESSGYGSVAVGYNTTATNTGSFSSGYQTTSSGQASITAGYLSTASGTASAAIGQEVTASATGSIAVGRSTTASAAQAFAAGRNTKAEAAAATALGYGTDATGARSLVAGAYNEPDTNEVDTTHGSGTRKYLMIIGNGTADDARSNAATLDWDGNLEVAGDVVTKDGSFNELKSDFDSVEKLESKTINPDWVQGSISSTSGDFSSNTRIRTGYIPVVNGECIQITLADGFQYEIDYYDSSKAWQASSGWKNSASDAHNMSSDGYVRFILKNNGDTAITPSASSNLDIRIFSKIVTAVENIESVFYKELKNVFLLSTTSTISRQFPYKFKAGCYYTVTNNTEANISFKTRLTAKGETIEAPFGEELINAGTTRSFTCSIDANWFNSWCPQPGDITIIETPKVFADIKGQPKSINFIFSYNGGALINSNEGTVSFEKDLVVFLPNEKLVLSASAVAEMLGSYAVYDESNDKITITVPQEQSLVYDFRSKTVQIVSTTNRDNDQMVLYSRYYKNDSGYLWTKFNVDRVSDGYYMKIALADIILTNNGRFKINTSAKTVSFSGSMYINSVGNRIVISASSVPEMLPDNSAYDANTNSVTITLTSEKKLVYSFEQNKLLIKGTISSDDILLFAEYYGNDYGLIWDKYWRDKFIDESNKNVLTASDIFNSEPYTGEYDWQTPVVSYGALFNGKQHVESFAFFTDPHTLGFADTDRNEIKMENSFKRIQKVYNSTPCSFIVCGGDWLNNSMTKVEACYRLGYLKGISKNMFNDFYLVLGNHDTNYQGKADSESANDTGRLTNETVASIMFRDTDTKKAYYSFDGSNSKCYVLDTGIEHNSMLEYDWEQVDWLAKKLIADDSDHSIIFMHILMQSGSVQTNASNFASVVEAYNTRATISLNSKSYDFTGCSGRVDFWVAGHTHADSTGVLGGIPYFITATNSFNSDVPLIDLVLADYDNREIKLVRVGGTGADRTISMDVT